MMQINSQTYFIRQANYKKTKTMRTRSGTEFIDDEMYNKRKQNKTWKQYIFQNFTNN